MQIIQKYITNTSSFQFIQLLRFGILFLIGIVFSRLYSKTQIGEYEVLLFAASAVSFFWLRGVLQTFLSLIKSDTTSSKSSTLFNAFILMVFFSILTIVFLLIFKNSISGFLTDGNELPYFKLLLVYIFFSSPSNLIEYIYLTQNKPKSIILYGLISYGLQFIALIIPPIFSLPVEFSIMGLIGINVLRFVFLIFILSRYSTFEFSPIFIKKHLKLSLPLIGSALLSGSGQYIDGIIVTKMFDASTFAIFRYGARDLPLVIIMANALSNSMIPDFINLSFDDALLKLKRNATWLMHLLFPITLVFLALSNWIFPIFFTPEFAYSAKIFNIYLLLIIPRLLFPQTILIGRQNTTIMLWVSLAEIIVNVVLSLLLVKIVGLWGVAFATFIANIFERFCLAIIVKVKYQTNLNKYVDTNWYLFYSLITIIFYVVVDFVLYR